MSALETIALTCKDIDPIIFSNYIELVEKEEAMRIEIQRTKEELYALGSNPDVSNDLYEKQLVLWPYTDSILEKKTEQIKLVRKKLSKCLIDYELLQTKTSTTFKDYQKATSKIMEMIAYMIQEIAHKETHSCEVDSDGVDSDGVDSDGVDSDGVDSDGVDSDGVDSDEVDSDYCCNPDFPKTNPPNYLHSLLMNSTTIIEPMLIIVLSVLIFFYYTHDDLSVLSLMV